MKAPYVSVYVSQSNRLAESTVGSPPKWEPYDKHVYEVKYDPETMGDVKNNFDSMSQWVLDNLEPFESAIGAFAYQGRMVTFQLVRKNRHDSIDSVSVYVEIPGRKKVIYEGDVGEIWGHSQAGWQGPTHLRAVLNHDDKVSWIITARHVLKHNECNDEFIGATISVVRSQTVQMMRPFTGVVNGQWLTDIGLSTRTKIDGGCEKTSATYREIFKAVQRHVAQYQPWLKNCLYQRQHYDAIVWEVKQLLASQK